jgi:microcystin-dependent protein
LANPFVGEIRIFGFNFAPIGWALCNGQLLPISQNTALFSLLGTQYGGDGRSNFALPNFQGCAPLNWGNGAGLTPRVIGESGGEETVTLTVEELPAHTHALNCVDAPGDQNVPAGRAWASAHVGNNKIAMYSNSTNAAMRSAALAAAGNSGPHNNMPPYLVLNFCIALVGIYPARS